MKRFYVEGSANLYVSEDGTYSRLVDDVFQKVNLVGMPYHYLSVGYVDLNNKRKTLSAHRVVAKYFVKNKNPELYTIVNHINGMKNDNRPANLEWCSAHDNRKHAQSNGLKNYRGLSPSTRVEIWKKYGHVGKDAIPVIREKYRLSKKAALSVLYLNNDGSSKYLNV